MLEAEREPRGKVFPQINGAVQKKFGILEARTGTQLHVRALGIENRVQIANRIAVEHQMMKIDLPAERGGRERASAREMEIRFARHGDTRRLPAVQLGQINARASEIKLGRLAHEVVVERAGYP